MSNQPQQPIQFRNPYFSSNSKVLYSQVKYDPISASKLKTNGKVIAFPDINGSGIGILELPKTGAVVLSESPSATSAAGKCNEHAPLVFGQAKQLQEYEFSHARDNILASSSRSDWLLRLWSTPEELANSKSTKEIDTPSAMLAGHEKRIDLIKFHPFTSKIMATGSQDKTVRIWDVEAVKDRSCIALPGENTVSLSLAFDLHGDFLNVAASDGNHYLYDPRANCQAPAQSRLSTHLPIKGIKICAVNPDPYFFSSGFSKDGSSRIVSLFDYRMNQEVGNFTIPESGPALLYPLADPILPIVYLAGKGEGVRIFEVSFGSLVYNSLPKLSNQFVGIDLIPNVILDRQKCEISRFVYLSNEKQFESTSIFIPRTKQKSSENLDGGSKTDFELYPNNNDESTAVIESADSWFQTLSPGLASAPQPVIKGRSATKYRPKVSSSSLPSQDLATSTCSEIQDSVDLLKDTKEVFTEDSSALKEYTPLVVSVDPQYFSSSLAMERKSWFSTTWEFQWMVMRSTRLYRISTIDEKLVPFAKYSQISKLKTCKVDDIEKKSRDIGFEFEFGGTLYRWRCDSNTERNQWISKLRSVIPGASKSSNPLPKLPQKQLMLLVDSCVEVAEQEKDNRIVWVKQSLALDGESMIHIYPPNLNTFNLDTPAEECLDLSTAFSVRASADSKPTLTVNTFKRAYHFRFKTESDLKDWTSTITSIIPDFQSKTMSVEGPVIVKYEGELQAEWLVFANFTLFYFSSKYSLTPLDVVDARTVRFFGENVDAYCTSEEPVLPIDQRIILSIDHRDETIHTFKTISDYKFWVLSFDKIRRACWDLYSRIGLDMNTIEQLYCDFKGDLPTEVVQYEEKQVVSGNKKFLFKIVDGSATAVLPSIGSLRIDKSFVLDAGDKIYQWTGDHASRIQRAEALNLATSLRKFRGCRPKLIIIDSEDVAELREFLAALGCMDTSQFMEVLKNEKKRRKISFTDNYSKMIVERQQIYRNTAKEPRIMAFVYQGDSPSKKILQDGCILRKKHEIFVWMSKGIEKEQKKRLLFTASKMAASIIQKYPFVFYAEEFEGRETPFFKSKFRDFPSDLPISMRIDEAKGNIARDIVFEKADIQKLLYPQPRPAIEEFGDDLDVKVYIMKSFERTPLPKEEFGCFCSTESYVISVSYAPVTAGFLRKCILYFWQGSRSTIIEKGTSALIAIEISKEIQGEVKQVRVTEGKEPPEFLRIFRNSCLPIFKRRHYLKEYSETLPLIFDVRSFSSANGVQSSRAYEIDLVDLKTLRNSLVIISPSMTLVFSPTFSSQTEKESATWIAKKFGVAGNETKLVSGADISAFLKEKIKGNGWEFVTRETSIPQSRLFTCSSTTGNTKIEEVFEYAQDDLDDQSVMILDSITTLYIWIGKTSKPKDQLSAIKAMQEYLGLQKRPSFDLSSNFIVTYAHQEPDSFTTHFHGWAADKIPKEMQGSTFVKTRPALDVLLELECKEYPKDVLLSEDLPDHVDRTRLEHYLSEVEFKEVFSMTRSDYEALPQWKQERLKRQAGLS